MGGQRPSRAGLAYRVRAETTDAPASRSCAAAGSRTEDLSLDQQTYASVAPLQGETVGVGMPVIVTFDVPVTDKASIERHMSVTSTPRQPGSWHWLSDQEVHWRPKAYWQAGTDVDVDVDINSVPAGDGIYGQESRHVDFTVGDANVYKVNAQTHQMQVFSNGELLRTLPITTGKPGFTTRSGVKVIIEKFREKRMNSETVGIDRDDPDAYDIDDVEYAMRVTYSGEFIHAAPWSVGSQGSANVSHGCTGMSTRRRRLALRHDQARRRRRVHRHRPPDDAGQRVRRLERHLRRVVRRVRPELTRPKLHADPPESFGRVSVFHRSGRSVVRSSPAGERSAHARTTEPAVAGRRARAPAPPGRTLHHG